MNLTPNTFLFSKDFITHIAYQLSIIFVVSINAQTNFEIYFMTPTQYYLTCDVIKPYHKKSIQFGQKVYCEFKHLMLQAVFSNRNTYFTTFTCLNDVNSRK